MNIRNFILAGALCTASITNAQTYKMDITVNGHTLTATMADNSSAEALHDLLNQGALTLNLNEYGDFEKVGNLGHTLPRNDERITSEAGDIFLYQGNQITIFYGSNTWSYTRLGRIDNVTKSELKDILGEGDVTVVLSLPPSADISAINADENVVSSDVYTIDGKFVGSYSGTADNLARGSYVIRAKLYNGKTTIIKKIIR